MKFTGTTIKGSGRGKQLGFPTINIKLSSPEYKEGVFAVQGILNGEKFQGVAHFGPRPTFEDTNLSVEIHIFDFSEETPKSTEVQFETVGRKIRDVKVFTSKSDLGEQIKQDIKFAYKALN